MPRKISVILLCYLLGILLAKGGTTFSINAVNTESGIPLPQEYDLPQTLPFFFPESASDKEEDSEPDEEEQEVSTPEEATPSESDGSSPGIGHFTDGAEPLPGLDGDDASEEEEPDNDTNEPAATEVVVYTSSELEAALKNATTILIRLGGDIAMTKGVTINPAKTELIIDGQDLENPSRIHTLTENYGSGTGETIGLFSGTSLKYITVRNLNIQGRNHYGTIYVSDSVRNVTILYENISYYGPQLSFNRYGTLHLNNAHVIINSRNSPSDPGEVGEVGGVILEGTVHLEQQESTHNELFWIELQSGTVEVKPGADVTAKTYTTAGFVFINASRAVDLIIGEDAVLRYTGRNRFWDGSALSGVTIQQGGQLYVDITANLENDAVLLVRDGDVTVAKDAVLHLRMLGGGTNAALRVTRGGSISMQDPRSVVLYAPNGRCIHYDAAADLYLEAQQINYWTNTPEMTLDNHPLYGWRKADGSNIYLSGTMNLGNWTSITSNYEEGDAPGVAPSISTASMVNARLLALGRAEVEAWYNRLSDTHSAIEGIASHPHSLARASTLENEVATLLGDVADTGEGTAIEILLDHLLPLGTEVTVETVGYYLWADTTFLVEPQALFLSHQAQFLPFSPTVLSPTVQIVPREDPDWSLVVYDSRPSGQTWKLWAVVRAPLSPDEEGYPPLDGALVYIDSTGTMWDLASDALIAQGISTGTPQETTVRWPADQGILVHLLPGTAYADIPYRATITWRLEDVP